MSPPDALHAAIDGVLTASTPWAKRRAMTALAEAYHEAHKRNGKQYRWLDDAMTGKRDMTDEQFADALRQYEALYRELEEAQRVIALREAV